MGWETKHSARPAGLMFETQEKARAVLTERAAPEGGCFGFHARAPRPAETCSRARAWSQSTQKPDIFRQAPLEDIRRRGAHGGPPGSGCSCSSCGPSGASRLQGPGDRRPRGEPRTTCFPLARGSGEPGHVCARVPGPCRCAHTRAQSVLRAVCRGLPGQGPLAGSGQSDRDPRGRSCVRAALGGRAAHSRSRHSTTVTGGTMGVRSPGCRPQAPLRQLLP